MRTLPQEDISEISTEAKDRKNCYLHYLEKEIEGMIKGKQINCITT